MIGFNDIPTTIRVPFMYVEFDNTRAVSGPALMPYRLLVVGQRLATGTIPALTPVRATSHAQIQQFFGKGSMLDQMAEFHFKNNGFTETYFVGLDDDGAAQAATGNITVGGAVTAGTIFLMIAARPVRVGVSANDSLADVATAIVAAINADATLPVTAAIDGAVSEQVNLTAKHKGEAGNGIDVRHNYYAGETLPTGLTLTYSNAQTTGLPNAPWEIAAATNAVAAYYGNIDPARPFQTLPLNGVLAAQVNPTGMRLSGGTANPTLDAIWAVVGDESYNMLAQPYTDASNLAALVLELKDRSGPLRMIECEAFTCAVGTHAELGTLGDSRNSEHLCIIHAGGPFDGKENNLLLFDGISTHYVDAGGIVRIQRLITTYKKSPFGAEDVSYLNVNTPLTLGYLRYDFRAYMQRKYPRHKLRDDPTGNRATPPNTMTPKTGRAESVARARVWEGAGLVENVDQFKAQVICERNLADRDRLDWLMPPDLVNQFRVGAAKIQFLL